MQSLSFEFNDSSNDADDINVEYIDDEDKDMDNELLCNLRNWSFEFKIKHNAINALMEILRHTPHSQLKTLPKDARTLLKTPKKTAEIVALSGGSYYHFGLTNTLQILLLHYKSMSLNVSKINLLINIDGLPLFRLSPSSFWPILLSDDILNQVHIVGLFYDQKKPKNANEFLQRFVEELISLVQRGYHSDLFNCDIKVNVKTIICDAPAKSFILNIKGHDYSSCTKYTIVPNNWLRISEDRKQQVNCFYPNYNVKKRLNKAIQSKEMPDLKKEQAGWAMYDVIRIFASADTFERGQEKLRMVENISDVNTEDEEAMKQMRHDRAAAKNYTSDDESSDTEVDSGLLSPLPDPKKFSGSQKLFHSEKPARILATYEHPIISAEDNIEIVTEKEKPKIIQQETNVIVKHKKKELEDKNRQDFINEDNNHSIDEYNKELTTHLNENNGDQSQKVLKEILKKVNRILIEITYIDRRFIRLENKVDYIINKEININTVEEAFAFDIISSMDELKLFEENLKSEEFFGKMKGFLKLKGGTNLQEMIKNIFKTLIEDEILMLYSWKGARQKNSF
ncbi:hypothetical protein ALC57_02435 [Trachymyrmex cornetzi]|uniref:DUF4806 domain-containing protein n=1 Tax=Trachymyrmex cornetzi TaxID=471704 RepID=A0A151JNT1_9HYME|nr:hypothetical protein ALC57_02435 [Trachymyrmex cornetzi]